MKRPILIQGAMEIEIKVLKEKIEDIEEMTIDGYQFYKGALEGYPIIISKTDIGIMNGAVSTMIGVKEFRPEIVINQGTAGASDLTLLTHDLVIGTSSININSFETPRKGKKEESNPLEWELKNFIEGKDKLVEILGSQELVKLCDEMKQNYTKGKVVFGRIGSGDVWNKEYDRIEWLNRNYHILCEDMETISVYTICNKKQIPVIGIRVISDNERIENQTFDRKSAVSAQEFALELCKEYIRRNK